MNYMKDNKLPEDKKEVSIIKWKTPKYWISAEGSLYRRSFSGPYLLCVHLGQIQDLLFEIHERICWSHMGVRSLAHRAMS